MACEANCTGNKNYLSIQNVANDLDIAYNYLHNNVARYSKEGERCLVARATLFSRPRGGASNVISLVIDSNIKENFPSVRHQLNLDVRLGCA